LKFYFISCGVGLLFLCGSISAQTLRRPVVASYTSQGAYSLHHIDVFSFAANQAALAQLSQTYIGIYGEKRFMLNELSNYQLALGIPVSSGNAGFKAGYYGSNMYNETEFGLAYARKLGSKADIGVQFNYYGIKIAGYGNASAVGLEVGAIFHLSDQLHTGIHIRNPVGAKFGKDNQEKIPSVYTIGLGYEASQKLLLTTEINKEETQPINVHAAIQYQLVETIRAKLGINTATGTAWMGVGFSFKTLRLDVMSSYHPQLGITPGISLVAQLKRAAASTQ
jgi:hypothetical protein